MLLVAVLASLAAGSEVIASTLAIDHAALAGEATSAASDTAAETPSFRWAFLSVYAALAIGAFLLARRRSWLDPGPGVRPASDRLPWLVALFFGFLAAQVAGISLAHAFLTAVAPASTETSPTSVQRLIALRLIVGLAAQVPFAWLTIKVLRTPDRAHDPPPATAFSQVGLGLVALLVAAPIILATNGIAGELQAMVRGTPAPATAHETLRRVLDDPGSSWSVALMFAVVAVGPVLEEISYRGALQGAFRAAGFSPWLAVTTTTFAFVLMHLGAIPSEGLAGAVLGLATLSLCLGLIRERSRSLLPSVVAHAAFNAANLAMAIGLNPPAR